jgi:glucosamine kinase
MKNIFIGVDGGGTKTKVSIQDEAGKNLGTGIGGPSNIRLSVDNAWDSIYNAINQALERTGITINDEKYSFHIGLGLAGVSILEAKKQFLNKPTPFKTLILKSDAHIACLGSSNGKNGAIVSIGTGVIGYLIDDNNTHKVSGWGFPHADTAGGAWLGMEITRLTFKWIDGCISPSPVLEDIFKHFNNDLTKLVQWANSANSSDFAKLAPYVVNGLKTEDKYSKQLFEKAGEEIDLLITALLKTNQSKENLSCSLMGGLAPFVLPFLNTKNIKLNNDNNAAIRGAQYLIRKNFSK